MSHFAYAAHILRRNSACSRFNANVENNEKSDDANHELNNKNEEENARERSDENNVSDSLLMSMSQVEFMISHVLCIC